MIQIWTEVKIEDYARFIPVFTTRGREMRTKHGCIRSQVFRGADPCTVYLLFDWQSKEAFDGFLADPMVKQTMKSSGSIAPKFTLLDKVCEIPG